MADQFKKDIERLHKSFETKQKQIESYLMSEKLKEIEQIKKSTVKEYQQKIVNLENNLNEQIKIYKKLEESIKNDQERITLQTKYDNENKLKIMKENNGTFWIAFENNISSPRR